MTAKKEILTYFQNGSKPHSFIGLEVEHFLLDQNQSSIPFEGPNGVENILIDLNKLFTGSLLYEDDYVIGMNCREFILTIEPGGQLEISISPQENIHRLQSIYTDFLHKLGPLLSSRNLYTVSMGYHPFQANHKIPWVPKKRYAYMSEYLKEKGNLAYHMMKSTTSTQVAFDYKDERDFSRKYSLANRLSVLSSIIFECSPFYLGKANSNHLRRIQCWMYCDDDRCGMMEKSFQNLYTFDNYMDYILDIPMIIENKNGSLYPIGNTTYRDYLKSFSFENSAFENQLTMAFPDIRLKNFIEIRTADGLSPDLVMSVPAFWTGLLYDEKNLNEWLEKTAHWKYEDLLDLRVQYIQDGNLDTLLYDQSIYQWILLLLQSSREGIERRYGQKLVNQSELPYLDPLIRIWAKKQSPQQMILNHYGSTNLPIPQYLQQYYKGGNMHEN